MTPRQKQMATHIQIDPGTLYPQPDHTIEVDHEGRWTITQVFLCHRNSVIALMPRIGTAHPEAPFVRLTRAVVRMAEGDLAEITCTYGGVTDAQDVDDDGLPNADDEDIDGDEIPNESDPDVDGDSIPNESDPTPEGEPEEEEGSQASGTGRPGSTYTMAVTMAEEPLLTHPSYRELDANLLAAVRQIMMGKDRSDSGEDLRARAISLGGGALLAKIDRGQTSYFQPRTVYRQSVVTSARSTAGTAGTPGRIGTPPGPVPALEGGANWILSSVNRTYEGGTCRIEREWMASGEGGWDEDIYGTGEGGGGA